MNKKPVAITFLNSTGNIFQLKEIENFKFKMKKILVILLFCAASTNCSDGLELKNLCSSDAFTYNGILVNSFFRDYLMLSFGPFRQFLIDNTIGCNENEFSNKTNIQKAYKSRDY